MKRNPNLLWLAALFLGWSFDFLFWKQSPGINFALYVLLCLSAGLLLLRLDRRRIAPGAALLLPLILFFSLITFIRAEPLTLAIAAGLTLTLMALLAISFLDGDWLRYNLTGYVLGLLRLGWGMLVRPLSFNRDLQNERAASGQPTARRNPWPVIRGLLIAIPVLVVFGSLLASADVVFGNRLDQLIRLLRLENLPEYVFRLLYILAAAYALAGVYLFAAGYGRTEKPAADNKGSVFTFLGFTEAAIVLGGVIILFGAFVLVQFRYFFGGAVNIGVEGYTYSEYARRGFGELLIVAFFSLLMILGLSTVTRREVEVQRRLFSGLAAGIVVLVLVMLVSAFQRLALYEAAYGFSRLRTYTHVFLVWIGLLLIAVAVLEAVHLERLFATAALISAVGFGVSLSLLNVDAFIVRQNVDRAVRGETLDTAYLVSLSTDAVPTIARIYQDESFPQPIREAMGAVLACRLDLRTLPRSTDWRSFNLSRAQADGSAIPLAASLSGYRYVDSDWPPYVVAPDGGAVYDCRGSSSY